MKTFLLISIGVISIGIANLMKNHSVNSRKIGCKLNDKIGMQFAFNNKNVTLNKKEEEQKKSSYRINRVLSRPIKKEQLNKVNMLSDMIPYYPNNWITSYNSVEISATCNGKDVSANSTNINLTAEQKSIINSVDMGTNIVINVNYLYRNTSNVIEKNTMHVLVTSIPNAEAEYTGGQQQMINYLNENAINKFDELSSNQTQKIKVRFNVSEEGKVTDLKISNTSGNSKINDLLLEAFNKMPKWKPAENSNGIKVKQTFEFTINNEIEGC